MRGSVYSSCPCDTGSNDNLVTSWTLGFRSIVAVRLMCGVDKTTPDYVTYYMSLSKL